MKLRCCFEGCGTGPVHDRSITLHKFPRSPVICSQWIKNLGTENFIPRSKTRLCSKHFEVDCFHRKQEGYAQLKPHAVPTIFNFKTNKDTSAIKEEDSPNVNDISLGQEQISNLVETPSVNEVSIIDDDDNAPSSINEVSIIDDNAPSIDEALDSKNEMFLDDEICFINDEIRLGLEKADKLVKLQNKKICSLREDYSSLRKKVTELNNILEEYKKKVYIPSGVLKKALARNKKKIVEDTVNVSSSTVNERCDNSVPIEEALANKETIANPTMNKSSSSVNENCDNTVPNSSFHS